MYSGRVEGDSLEYSRWGRGLQISWMTMPLRMGGIGFSPWIYHQFLDSAPAV